MAKNAKLKKSAKKKFEAKALSESDFKTNVALLQIDGMYNPKPETFNNPVTFVE